MMTGTWYGVASGEYDVQDVILYAGPGGGPYETIRDFLYVKATTSLRAKVLFVRAWRRRTNGKGNAPLWLTDGNPFAGMQVMTVTDPPCSPRTTWLALRVRFWRLAQQLYHQGERERASFGRCIIESAATVDADTLGTAITKALVALPGDAKNLVVIPYVKPTRRRRNA